METRKRLNRAFSALFDRSVVSASTIQRIESQLAEISGQVESLRQLSAAPALTAVERHQLERFRLEQRLLAGWEGRERELVARVRALMSKLQPVEAVGFEKIRVGSRNDGGYVLLDDFARVGLALSFGVEHNADWDVQMADRGAPVRQYDHTIEKAPVRHPLITWEKKRIAAAAGPDAETISGILQAHVPNPRLPNAVLKIDIEHAEWEVFDATPREDLRAFSQIAGEFHGFDYLADHALLSRFERVVEKLTSDFAVIHVHANNHCGVTSYYGVSVPWVLEFTFANRSLYEFRESVATFPGPLDAPCDPDKPDLWLGRFQF